MELVNRYGDELEYDLHQFLTLDLADWFRGRHAWGKLIRMAAQLPAHSRYKAALADDDELAERYVAEIGTAEDERRREGKARRQAKTMADWSPELSTLADLVDGVQELHASFAQANSKKGTRPKVRHTDRPMVALDRVRYRRDLSQAERVRNAFSPRED